MSANYVLINDDFVLKQDAKILINDLSVQRGYGVFDFFKTVHGEPVFLDDHLDRLYASAAEMFLPLPFDRDGLKEIIRQLMKKNNLPDSGIRITLTGGYAEDGYAIGKPNLLITQSVFTFDKAGFEKGTRLVTFEHQRQLPHVKTIDYLQAIRLQHFIRQNNADDVLYYGASGIGECPRSNFFVVTNDDEIITPDKNILHGITRKKILQLAGFSTTAAAVYPEQIASIKEAFITSTTKVILPVLRINGQTIGDGKPGAVTSALFNRLLSFQGIG
jgi:D-alanine transaminase/branched-chain amino acid aminotransferase